MNYNNHNYNIAILTTVVNFDLYKKTSSLFPKDIPLYVIDGRDGMHGLDSIFYMFKKLSNKKIDWLIMADEDVIFEQSDKVFGLIDYMAKNNYFVSGVRDGGVVSHRDKNPYLINTFFSILNFSEIKKIISKREILKNNYSNENEFKDDLSSMKYKYDTNSLYEPYYSFYLWLRRSNYNFLFLDALHLFENDLITNSVLDLNGEVLLHHTWHARSYGVNKKHTDRIDFILNKCNAAFASSTIKPIVFKDFFYKYKKELKKTFLKIQAKFN